jgi:hypothetical protein
MNAATERAALRQGIQFYDELTAAVDDRTLDILDRRRRTAVVKRRGWLVRRMTIPGKFRGGLRHVVGLLSSARPDAVAVDDPIDAAEARSWAQSQDLPLVHICLRQRKLRVLRNGDWEETLGASAESIPNVIARLMCARSGVRT